MTQRIKNTKKNSNSNIRTRFTQTRERKRIRRMKGGSCNKPIAVVGSAWQGGDINTWLNSNHLPLSDSGVSPSPDGINTRDILFGGEGRGKIHKKGILKVKKGKKHNNKSKNTKKIRFVENKRKNSNRSKKIKLKKGGSGLVPDDISNLKNSLIGRLTSTVNDYKGVPTPYQVNHVYPYQQPPYSESYMSTISDANAMYNSADNIVLTNY